MTDLLVYLSSNGLKVTYKGKEGIGGFSSEIPASIAEGSNILDVDKFSESLGNLLAQSVPTASKKNISLNFLVNPEQVYLYFVPVGKNGSSVEEQVISGIKEKLPSSVSMEDLYFSYQKIAPFIYQFVGVKKEELEKYLSISNNLGISLMSVIPWVLLLPKLVNDNRPSIFISRNSDGRQTVALSELGGIYFSHTYNEEKSQEELVELVQQLSLYNRSAPINKIYTVNYDSISLGDTYEVLPLEFPEGDTNMAGFEVNLLHNKVVSSNQAILSTKINLLNLLPVPVVQKKKLQLVPVAAVAAPVVIALLLIAGFFFFRQDKDGTIEPSEVLSESSETTQSQEVVTPPREVVEENKPELKQSDLQVRIENGTSISGLAGKTQEVLEKLGYKVTGIGDSDKDNMLVTELSFKLSKKEYEELLKGDMGPDYTLKVDYDLDESSEYDVLITVGSSE